ncbi:uncharacterized protein CDV56_100454 [Aspergillus thermomutatus]|uniref:Uncharacterized protein n=1 Tax=Aspergillus thermomutatus TaxID=41047 RepID=A0A397G001_ASPTH|nr:uncharacterized protein CDV56_100454 [Aspergillus thermomutatus]RHZ43154.1 hypothetical protein CDV56_100454 [Aspergillus thermomutatus]
MKSATAKVPNGHGSIYKEVRFSPTATPIRRAQSVSTSNPASKFDHGRVLGKEESNRFSYSALSADHLEQARSLVDRQRASFENERALFAQERQLWERERALLRLRISELEALLKSKGTPNAGPPAPGTLVNFSLNPFGGPVSPNLSNERHHNHNYMSAQVWEGPSPMSRPTRVFHDVEKTDGQNHLASIMEQGAHLPVTAPSLDAALSPQSRAAELSACASIPVPIEKLDSKLDGITLKSTALPPEVVARVMTPPSPSPVEVSPEPSDHPKTSSERKNSLKLKLSELGPPDVNLIRDAGHTPMALIDADADTEQASLNGDVITQVQGKEEEPLAPRATMVGQPAENNNSYFPDVPDDPALKGPLSLLNEEEHDSEFLQELDLKLLDQARRAIGHSSDPDPEDQEVADADITSQDESVPELKFKNTTNFGTAFGISDFGKV